MEGVMMRAPHSYCVAVRRANGDIVTEESPLPRLSEKYPIFKLPVLRGLGTLGQAMGLGFRALRFSAAAVLDDVQITENVATATAGAHGSTSTVLAPPSPPKEMPRWMMWLNLAFSIGFFLLLYKFVPLFLATLLGNFFPSMHGRLAINLVDGTIRHRASSSRFSR